MQFNYTSHIDDDMDFETEIRTRLGKIENMLTSFSAQNDLLQEVIRKDIRTNSFVSTPAHSDTKPLTFNVCKIQNKDDNIIAIRVYGKTYDIRERIRQFPTASWRSDIKTWELEYSEETYISLMGYLQSLTKDVSEKTIVEVI